MKEPMKWTTVGGLTMEVGGQAGWKGAKGGKCYHCNSVKNKTLKSSKKKEKEINKVPHLKKLAHIWS